jgi:hypothetical protein
MENQKSKQAPMLNAKQNEMQKQFKPVGGGRAQGNTLKENARSAKADGAASEMQKSAKSTSQSNAMREMKANQAKTGTASALSAMQQRQQQMGGMKSR